VPDATLGQTSHLCGTEWSNIIFAQQMHHIAAGDASLTGKKFYDIIKKYNKIRICK